MRQRLYGDARKFMTYVNDARKRREDVAYVPDDIYWIVIAEGGIPGVVVAGAVVGKPIEVRPESRR